MSCLPFSLKDRIAFDNPKSLEEAMRKANFCYEQSKNKKEGIPKWKNKRTNNFSIEGKVLSPAKVSETIPKIFLRIIIKEHI